jgi:hypothetical protein
MAHHFLKHQGRTLKNLEEMLKKSWMEHLPPDLEKKAGDHGFKVKECLFGEQIPSGPPFFLFI